MVVKDGLESIKEYVEARLVSPLFGALIVSWIAWNHRAILVVFSDLSILDAFKHIDAVLYPTDRVRWLHGLVYPALTALGYLLIFWWPSSLVLQFTHWQKTRTANSIKVIEGMNLLTHKEGKDLLAQAETDRVKIEALRLKNSELDAQLRTSAEERETEMQQAGRAIAVAKAQAIPVVPKEMKDRLTEYICSCEFLLETAKHPDTKHIRMTFSRRGKILKGNQADLAGWQLEGDCIHLLGEGKDVMCVLRFEPERMIFNMVHSENPTGAWLRLTPIASQW